MAKVLFNIDYSGQSNKAFTSVNYDYIHTYKKFNCNYDSRAVNYEHKMFIRLVT